MTTTTPRIAEAAAQFERASLADLAAAANVPFHALDTATAAALSAVRDDMCEKARYGEEIDARELADCAENADYDHPGTYLAALRLATALRTEIREAAAEECRLCGGTGEAWFDVELDSGRVAEDMRPCPCGGA